ncbi:hypothetical protein DV736_g6046, partial [Chaetothyriales sp. CBS 134916]
MSTGDTNGAQEEGKGRTRVSRACTRCRTRKDKCDGLQPSCLTCQNAGVPELCAYEPPTKKRGLQEGYVRGLEKLYSVLMMRVEGFEETVVQLLSDERDALTRVWNHKTHGDSLHQAWKESSIMQQLEVLLAAVEHPHAAGNKRKRDQDDDEGPPTSSLTTSASSPSTLHDVLTKTTHSISALARASPLQWNRQVPATANSSDKTFILPKGASEAINTYFSSVHCWLPILDRGEMRKRCFELARCEVRVDTSDAGLAKLSAALVLSSLQSPLITEADTALDVSYLYDISKQCIPFRDGLYVLGHVQALVLLVLADISSNRWPQAWFTIGLASRIIQDLVGPTKALGKEETATYQACFILDTLVSFRLQRMPQLRRNQLPAYLVEDGHDEWEPVAAAGQGASSEPGFLLSTFNRVIDLFAILNDRICSPDGRTPTTDLERLALSYYYTLSDNSALSSHKIALKAIHSAMSAYFTEAGPFGTGILHTLNVASSSLKQCPDHTSSIIATATLEAIRHKVRVGGMVASSTKRPPFDSTMNSLELWPAGPFTTEPPSYPSQQPTTAATSSQVDDPLGQSSSTNPVGMAFSHVPLSHHKPVTPYNPIISTSPSLHGDDIDALFREMAQLDTTEWADGRNQGLKDFGFADAMTFEAFCNDPNRVLSSYQQPDMPDQSSFGIPPILQEPRRSSDFKLPSITEMSWIG